MFSSMRTVLFRITGALPNQCKAYAAFPAVLSYAILTPFNLKKMKRIAKNIFDSHRSEFAAKGSEIYVYIPEMLCSIKNGKTGLRSYSEIDGDGRMIRYISKVEFLAKIPVPSESIPKMVLAYSGWKEGWFGEVQKY